MPKGKKPVRKVKKIKTAYGVSSGSTKTFSTAFGRSKKKKK
jgi:hypothetical protein